MHDLTRSAAIHLYQKGRVDEARQVLLECIRNDPQDVPSWMWLVATIEHLDERIATLRLCLKANPDNAEVKQALVMLASQKNTADTQAGSPQFGGAKHVEDLEAQSAEEDILLPGGWIREMQGEAPPVNKSSTSTGEKPISLLESKSGLAVEPGEPGTEHLSKELPLAEATSVPAGASLATGQAEHEQQAVLHKPSGKKSIFGFVFKVFAILVMLAILFSIVFIAWWVGTGHTTRELLFSLAPESSYLVAPASDTATAGAPAVQPVLPATFTPVPTPAPTSTPAPTVDPALVMVIPGGMQTEGTAGVFAVDASGRFLAYQTGSRQVKVIRLETGEVVFETNLTARLLAAVFSDDGKRLAAVDEVGILSIWETERWEEEGTAQLLTDTGAVISVQLAFTLDGSGLLAGYCPALDGACTGIAAVGMYNIPGGNQRYTLAGVNRFAFSSGNQMAVWQEGKALNVLKLVSQFSGDAVQYLQLPAAAQQEGFAVAAISPDGSAVAGATEQGNMAVWNMQTGQLTAAWQSGVRDAGQVIFGSGNSQVLVGNLRSAAQVWDYAAQQLVTDFNLNADYGTFFLDSTGAFRCVRTVTPVIELWDVAGLQLLESFSWGDYKVTGAATTLQKSRVITISSTGEISLWRSTQLR
jgi:hypothetical protein